MGKKQERAERGRTRPCGADSAARTQLRQRQHLEPEERCPTPRAMAAASSTPGTVPAAGALAGPVPRAAAHGLAKPAPRLFPCTRSWVCQRPGDLLSPLLGSWICRAAKHLLPSHSMVRAPWSGGGWLWTLLPPSQPCTLLASCCPPAALTPLCAHHRPPKGWTGWERVTWEHPLGTQSAVPELRSSLSGRSLQAAAPVTRVREASGSCNGRAGLMQSPEVSLY